MSYELVLHTLVGVAAASWVKALIALVQLGLGL